MADGSTKSIENLVIGDAQNVTIFGQSGGGGKVSTLLATPSAKGLYHKAIVQSGSMLRTMDAKYSRRIGAAVMDELGLKASQIDELQKMPYERLLAAGEKAVAKVKAEAEKEDGISTFIFGWAPTVDGDVLPAQPFDPQAPAQSKDVPVMIGTTLHEFTMSTYVPAFRTITKEKAVEFLKQRYGDRTDDFLAAFEKAYPGYRPKDLVDVDLVFRPGAVEQARLKAAQQGAPVYMYMFAWESPVLDGMFRSTHCMEIPFAFNNAVAHASMTGGGAEAQALAEKMSGAWLNLGSWVDCTEVEGPGRRAALWVQGCLRTTEALPTDVVYKLYVNDGQGIPPGSEVTITLPLYSELGPKQYITWWNGGRMLLADEDVLKLRYIFRNENESTWDAMLVQCMTLAMAARMAYAITQSASLEQGRMQELEMALKRARAIDGQDDPPETFGDNRLLGSRY
jgi:hypothetical protein